MPELLKNMYNPYFFEDLSPILKEVLPDFDKKAFLNQIFVPEWENLELKGRMQHISRTLSAFLPAEFPLAVPYLLAIKEKIQKASFANSFAFMFLPDYIEQYGLSHIDLSVTALQEITSLASAEFAVRPFLIKYPEKMLDIMEAWSIHPDLHVRRLASEGCRPRLPWAMAVPFLKKDPSLIIPILNNLKADSSEYVRRSVANNLNDISRDHPHLVCQLTGEWKGYSPNTNKLLKHACRTLIKAGNPQVLQLFGFGEKEAVEGYSLVLNKQAFHLNETVEFTFSCIALKRAEVRLQYVVDFARKNGKAGKKVFYLDEKNLAAGEHYTICRKMKLQNYTTRTLYQGQHKLSIMLNGQIKTEASFYLHIN